MGFKYKADWLRGMVECGYNLSVSEKITTSFVATFATFVNDSITGALQEMIGAQG